MNGEELLAKLEEILTLVTEVRMHQSQWLKAELRKPCLSPEIIERLGRIEELLKVDRTHAAS